jgi:hypothetical protein
MVWVSGIRLDGPYRVIIHKGKDCPYFRSLKKVEIEEREIKKFTRKCAYCFA